MRHEVSAIPGAGYHPVELPDRVKNYRGAWLEAGYPVAGVTQGHKFILCERDSPSLLGQIEFVGNRPAVLSIEVPLSDQHFERNPWLTEN